MTASYRIYQTEYQATLQSSLKKQQVISSCRFLAILGFFAFLYFYIKIGHQLLFAPATGLLIVFLLLLKKYRQNAAQINLLQTLIHINKDEIAYLEKGILNFDAGKEFLDPEHSYTYDLDIFGEDSLFQHMNRTGTLIGKLRLAKWFQQQDLTAIPRLQEAIQELAPAAKWRQHYSALGKRYIPKEDELQHFSNWLNAPNRYLQRNVTRIFSWLLPAATIATLLFALYLQRLPIVILLISLVILNLSFAGLHFRYFRKEFSKLQGIHKILGTYSHLLKSIEGSFFKTAWLRNLQKNIFFNNHSAADAIDNLVRILSKLEEQSNSNLIMNGLFLDGIHAIYAMECWRTKYAMHVPDWTQVIAELDALNSLANFHYNNEDFIFPQLSWEPVLSATSIGHPLISKGKRIYNDIAFDDGQFIILTGSNMSGKSTFLRTLGVNLLLARMGAPVCADQCHIFPFEIFVSMKINDSLHDNESLFFAELKRLKRIIYQVKKESPTFVILDEILRGTNSNDKHTGTSSLVKKLAEYHTYGIIATHDLTISEMANEYPGYLKNNCFEVEIVDDKLHFDYKLKPSICEKMSAVFLMRQMEII